MKNLRVCNVDEEGRFGGPERRIVQVAHALRQIGIETCVVYPSMESEAFERYIQEYNVDSKQLDITRLTKQKKVLLRYAIRFLYEIYLLAKFFRTVEFDIVHVNGAYQFKVAIAAKLSAIPVVWHLNDTYAPAMLKRVFNAVVRRCATGFIVAGKRVWEYYLAELNLDNRTCAEIHAPVNLKVFDPDKYADKCPKPDNRLRIGTVSSVNPAKGLEHFVEMAADLLSHNPNLEIIVAGSILESQQAYFKSVLSKMMSLGLEKDDIQFVGLVEDVPAFLDSLDICVFTSVTEASPTSVWEALAMAKPVVTTDAGSVRQYIENGVSGFVVPVADVSQLISCINKLIEDEGQRMSLGSAARQVAIKYLSIEAAAELHAGLYRRVHEKVKSL